MKILIYGGKFNPMHNGHIESVKQVSSHIDFDQVWLLPSGLPFEKQIMDKNTRVEIIKNAAQTNGWMINSAEIDENSHVPTIKVLKDLEKQEDQEWFFLIGADQVNIFHEWNDAEVISKMVNLLAVQRKEVVMKDENIKKYKIRVISSDLPKVSSTEIRKGDFANLDSRTRVLLFNDHLFVKNLLREHISEPRVQHSMNVAKKSLEYAGLYMPSKAEELFLAGALHDINKEKSKLEQAEEIKNLGFENEPVATWHQWTGSQFVKNKLMITDKDIISSIANHTTANIDMSLFDKIVYCADKTSEERTFNGVDKLRTFCNDGIDVCFIEVFKKSLELISKKGKISDRTKKIKEYILNA